MLDSLARGSSPHAQLVRYAFVAGIGLVLDFSTVIITKELFGFYYLWAAVTGFVVGLVFTYFASNSVVFGTPKGDARKAFVLFALIGIVGLGILSVLMALLTGLLGINYIFSKTLATIVVFTWNFLARRSLYT